jgi:formamidopyrimidine-DNA glycosylase
MPELPEVEVTRRMLVPMLVGRTIASVRATAPSYFFLTSPAVLRRRLPGRRIEGLDRVGKYILARLDGGERLLLHLGMTGEIFREGAAVADGHTHLRLRFADGGPDVLFRDERKFGKVQLLARGEDSRRLARLGVDALALRPGALHAAARRRRVAIKTLLLNQSVLAGVGNIYADEALFLAGVRPTRQSRRVTLEDCRRLVAALKRVLRRSIAAGGTTISDYIRPDGQDGGYQEERRVYGRDGEPCPRCQTPIRRRVLGQRSAHYCPRCQT